MVGDESEDLKGSEFIQMVAEMLEFNLKALDRVQLSVEDHVCAGDAKGALGGFESNEAKSFVEVTERSTVRRGPRLATQEREKARRAGQLPPSYASGNTSGAGGTPRKHAQQLLSQQSGEHDVNSPRAWVGTTARVRTSSARPLPDHTVLHTCTLLSSGKSRTAAQHVSCKACRGASSAGRRTTRPAAAAQPRRPHAREPGVCIENGKLIAATTIPLLGASPAERNALLDRLLAAVDTVAGLALEDPGVQAYLFAEKRRHAVTVYRELLPKDYRLVSGFRSDPVPARQSVSRTALSAPEIRFVAKKTLEALAFLHAAGTAHGYIRPDTLWYRRDPILTAKRRKDDPRRPPEPSELAAVKVSSPLIDWAARASSGAGGTWLGKESPYLPPEQLLAPRHAAADPTAAADVWAVGCVFMELLTNARPWQHLGGARESVHALLVAATRRADAGRAKRPLPLPRGIAGLDADFLLRCFEADPAKRPSAAALAGHPAVAYQRDTVTQTLEHRAPFDGIGLAQVVESPPSSPDPLQQIPAAVPRKGSQTTPRSAEPMSVRSVLIDRARLSGNVPRPLDHGEVTKPTGFSSSVSAHTSPYHQAVDAATSPLFITKAATPTADMQHPPGGSSPGRSPLKAGSAASLLSLRRGESAAGSGRHVPAKPQEHALASLSEQAASQEQRMGRFEESMQRMAEKQDATNGIILALLSQEKHAVIGPGLHHQQHMQQQQHHHQQQQMQQQHHHQQPPLAPWQAVHPQTQVPFGFKTPPSPPLGTGHRYPGPLPHTQQQHHAQSFGWGGGGLAYDWDQTAPIVVSK
ncbi:Serine/threonine-protein kinase BCK1/SLK1/SSP31 [Diplonema papillatum]|nr:Serine/threonine-protein kinase BCK1/SLK1/SSP31 [Diplonema papillatum]